MAGKRNSYLGKSAPIYGAPMPRTFERFGMTDQGLANVLEAMVAKPTRTVRKDDIVKRTTQPLH